jgi:hypothetical protein
VTVRYSNELAYKYPYGITNRRNNAEQDLPATILSGFRNPFIASSDPITHPGPTVAAKTVRKESRIAIKIPQLATYLEQCESEKIADQSSYFLKVARDRLHVQHRECLHFAHFGGT